MDRHTFCFPVFFTVFTGPKVPSSQQRPRDYPLKRSNFGKAKTLLSAPEQRAGINGDASFGTLSRKRWSSAAPLPKRPKTPGPGRGVQARDTPNPRCVSSARTQSLQATFNPGTRFVQSIPKVPALAWLTTPAPGLGKPAEPAPGARSPAENSGESFSRWKRRGSLARVSRCTPAVSAFSRPLWRQFFSDSSRLVPSRTRSALPNATLPLQTAPACTIPMLEKVRTLWFSCPDG